MRPKAPETIGNKILPADPFETVDMGWLCSLSIDYDTHICYKDYGLCFIS